MTKRNRWSYWTVAVLLAACFAACVRDAGEPNPDVPDGRLPASLSIEMRTSDIRAAIETRSLVNPDSDNRSEEELLADGSTIRRLTVMLIDSINKEMVAYRHIIYDGEDSEEKFIHRPLLHEDGDPQGGNGFLNDTGAVDLKLHYSDKVRLTFNYDNPLHGDVERLKHGKYVLMAVANYGSLPVIDDDENDSSNLPVDHPSVKGYNGFVKQLHAVIHRFYGDDGMNLSDTQMSDLEFLRTKGVGIKNFGASLAGFYNYVLSVALDENGKQPFVRKKLDALPLFTIGYIDLQPGENFISEPIPLYRTYARVRMEVKNYSEKPLSVYDLKFSENFSKNKTYFCRMPGALNIFEGLNYKPGAPDVSYKESIIAFPYYNTNIGNWHKGEDIRPGADERYFIVDDTDAGRGQREVGTGQLTIEHGQTAALFDAYISASRDDNGDKYKYTIDLGYEGVDYPSYSVADTPASSAGEMYCVIRDNASSRWLYEEENGVPTTVSADFETLKSKVYDGDARFVWRLIPSGSSYYLQNAQTGDWISASTSGVTTSSSQSSRRAFSVSVKSGLFTFSFSSGRNSYYLYSTATGSVSSNRTVSSSFELCPVEYSNSARKKVEVVLQTIDNQTSAVTDVVEICRNDFVYILVEVSYNPDKGDFEFEVQPWTKGKGGDITFN